MSHPNNHARKQTNVEIQKTDVQSVKKTPDSFQNSNTVLFSRENYMWMLIGFVVILLGFILMSGGKSADPNVFNDDQIYGFRRITLAPILIVAGLGIEVFAIMKKKRA